MTVFDRFQAAFGQPYAASGTAPGRINLIGEHIDYNGGTVLPTALPNKTEIVIAPNTMSRLRIQSERFDGLVERDVTGRASGHWSDYVVGSVAVAKRLGWIEGGLDIYVESTIPDGAGVSSSAALCTAVLRAAMIHADADLDPKDLAMQARTVETDYIGVPCGIMDQMAVGLIDPGDALILDTVTEDTETLDIPDDWSFVTLHSGVHRKLSDGRYEERFRECAAATAALGAKWLCRLDDAQAARAATLAEPLAQRTRHVASEHKRTLWAIGAMRSGDIDTFGRLMQESHWSYARDFDASTPGIDRLVEAAIELGAAGSRLTGGGFGGCVVSLLRTGDAEAWTADMLARFPKAWLV